MVRVLVRRRWSLLLPLSVAIGAFSASGRMVAGAACGLILGFLVVVIQEYRASSFSSEEDVSRVLALPVLGTIPVIASDAERQMRRHRRIAAELAGFAALVFALVLALWRLRPIGP